MVNIAIGNLHDSGLERSAAVGADVLLEQVQRLDALGYHSVWSADGYGRPSLDPLTALTAMAAATRDLRLGTCVLVAPLHHPLNLAHLVATLDNVSGGRFLFGVGVGWRAIDFKCIGLPFHERGARTNELLRILRAGWATPGPFDFAGQFYRFEGVRLPPTVRKPHPPFYIAGESEAALKRVATLGDGWIPPSIIGPEEVRQGIERIHAFAARAGRELGRLPVVAELNGNIAADVATAEADADRGLATKGGRSLFGIPWEIFKATGVWGPADLWIRRIEEYGAVGADTVMVRFYSNDLATQLERFHEQVWPAFRDADHPRGGR